MDEVRDLLFFNFFSISILIGVVFYFLVSAFIFFAIKEKSTATRVLGFAYLTSAILALPYFIAHTLYYPGAAIHRWFTVSTVLLSHPVYTQLFYYFPKPKFKRAGIITVSLQCLIGSLLAGYFIYSTQSREIIYTFSSHLWDYDADDLSRMVALMMVVNLINLVVAGIIHIVARKGDRIAVASILGGFLITILAPTVTNIMSRDGLMSRDIHQTVLILCSICGLFTVFVVYLNSTTDKTTFMVKITGVSLVTFMVVMVFISWFSFQQVETNYDALHAERTSRLAVEPDYPVNDLKYLASYDLQSKKIEILRHNTAGSSNNLPNFNDALDDFVNHSIYEKIRTLDPIGWKEKLPVIISDAPEHFNGYKLLLLELTPMSATPADLLNRVGERSRRINYSAIKIQEIPENGFSEKLDAFVMKMHPDAKHFADAIRKYRAENPSVTGRELKEHVTGYFKMFSGDGIRHYRAASRTHFTSFMRFDPKKNIIFEAGYSYPEYRRVVHEVGVKIAWIFLAIICAIIFGFPLFFLGTLVRPLDSLLAGVRKVNAGDLSVDVPVAVADEIGFLTESFNGMVSSIRQSRQKLQRHAEELEDKVRERTAELSETLRAVQELKYQQDADYFLTSLLIKPLTRNLTVSDTVQVEFLIEQKKKFEFRHWREELGGDFCSAHSIKLRDHGYTVFVNADAMGKSMQGAGGALVLGAVFESLMERTRVVPSMRTQSPERWIKNSFQELQGVFESFDGSMLVSMVLGLIDEETGLLYYVNVEHPWSALFRNGSADFVEKEHMFRKLGMPGLAGRISVNTFQLNPGDVLIVGSDGRDDIMTGLDENGERIINEDETQFLRLVEASEGKLPRIRSHLGEMGTLTDDLSLIRIAYRSEDPAPRREDKDALIAQHRNKARKLLEGKYFAEAHESLSEALNLDSKNLKTIRMIVRLYVDQKEYQRAFPHVEDYIYIRPRDTDMIYLASYLCKKLKKYSEAAEFGERVRLRAPSFVRNQVNLAEVYIRLGNRERARKLLNEVIAIDPENRRAIRIQEALSA